MLRPTSKPIPLRPPIVQLACTSRRPLNDPILRVNLSFPSIVAGPSPGEGFCSCNSASGEGVTLCSIGQTCFDRGESDSEFPSASCQVGCPSGYALMTFTGAVRLI